MWIRIDDATTDHPKLVAAGPLAGWLWVCGLTYSARYLTDGHIPARQLPKLADVDNPTELAQTLVDVGLWIKTPGGYDIHDFLHYNPPAAVVRRRRHENRERMRRERTSAEPIIRTEPTPSETTPEPDPGEKREAAHVLKILKETATELNLQVVELAIGGHPETDPVQVALEYARYQERESAARSAGRPSHTHRDRISGWTKALDSAKKRGFYRRAAADQAEPPAPIEPSDSQAWDDARAELRASMGDDNYRQWIAPLRLTDHAGGVLTLEAPDDYHRDWIEQRLITVLANALTTTGHEELTITVRVPTDDSATRRTA